MSESCCGLKQVLANDDDDDDNNNNNTNNNNNNNEIKSIAQQFIAIKYSCPILHTCTSVCYMY